MNTLKAVIVFVSVLMVVIAYLVGCFEIEFAALPKWLNVAIKILFACYTPFVFNGVLTEMFKFFKIKPSKEI